jgi:putative membrane protein
VLTAEDHARIEAAVREAETGTSGAIYCVLAGEVSSYREVPIAWGAAAALLIPPIVLAFGLRYILVAFTGGGWTAAQAGAIEPQMALVLTGYAVSQTLLFAAVALVVSLAPIRRRLTPRFLKTHRVKKAAFHHFVAAHTHARESETGVLIFVALVDRQVQVLADRAIHEKAGDIVWNGAARAVQDGMRAPDPTAGIIDAIRLCGEALKAHFPSDKRRVFDRVAEE